MRFRGGVYFAHWLTFGLGFSCYIRAGGRKSGAFLRILWWTFWFDVDERAPQKPAERAP